MEGTHPLKDWRLAQHPPLSQEDAAVRLSVTKATISRWESFDREPSLTQAAKLSEETGIPIDQFVRQRAQPEPAE